MGNDEHDNGALEAAVTVLLIWTFNLRRGVAAIIGAVLAPLAGRGGHERGSREPLQMLAFSPRGLSWCFHPAPYIKEPPSESSQYRTLWPSTPLPAGALTERGIPSVIQPNMHYCREGENTPPTL